jgi:hypothetical protein
MELSSQFHVLTVLPPGERAPISQEIGGGVGPRDGVNVVAQRKISVSVENHTPVIQCATE